MRFVAKGIENPDVEVREHRQTLIRHVIDVARVGKTAEAEAKGIASPVPLPKRHCRYVTALTPDRDKFIGSDAVFLKDRRIVASLGGSEAVGEARPDDRRGRLIKVDVDASAVMNEKGSQIVDTMRVIRVVVRE